MNNYQQGENYVTLDGGQVYWWDGGDKWRVTTVHAGDYEFERVERARDMPEGLVSLTEYSGALWVESNVKATFGSAEQLSFEVSNE